MKRILILLNKLSDFDFSNDVKIYLGNHHVEVGINLPINSSDYDLIVAWSYRKIIQNISTPNNIIIFHSSNLPKGKGWAPIYNSIASGEEYFVISGILAASKVDSGDLVIKAKFKIKPEYMAKDIRLFDKKISLLLVGELLSRFQKNSITGIKQVGDSSFNKRRYKEDNEIDIKKSFASLISHFRACEESAPPFFYYKNVRYDIKVTQSLTIDEEIPSDLEIFFFC